MARASAFKFRSVLSKRNYLVFITVDSKSCRSQETLSAFG